MGWVGGWWLVVSGVVGDRSERWVMARGVHGADKRGS